jgi:hypothetical protein
MADSEIKTELAPRLPRYPEGVENIWHEFWRSRQPLPTALEIRARTHFA